MAPIVQVDEAEISGEVGGSVELRCGVTGTPPPRVQWVRRNGELPQQSRMIGNSLL